MKILVTGRRTSGSWPIRGEQLGTAIGATVQVDAADARGFDLAIIVKRPRQTMLDAMRKAGVPIIWDVVDSYPQPEGNDWGRARCMEWLTAELKSIRPIGVVAATRAMAHDCEGLGYSVLALPHHARPGQALNPIRRTVQAVAYEGGEQYLGAWRGHLERECTIRGWCFLVNPKALCDVDILVALRQQTGYAPRFWKSAIKLANAQGNGTPCILNRESGYLETASGVERWADTPQELADGLDALTDLVTRQTVAVALRAAAPTLENVAKTYRAWLDGFG